MPLQAEYADVREIQNRRTQQAAQEMGGEAEAWQAILPLLLGSAEVGRHHVRADHDFKCSCTPHETGVAACGQLADSLSSRRICLGTVHMVCERKTLWGRHKATEFDQG